MPGAKTLWTPGGNVTLNKELVKVTRDTIAMLAMLDKWTSENRVGLVCMNCDSAIVGQNTGHEKRLKIACKCREWVYERV